MCLEVANTIFASILQPRTQSHGPNLMKTEKCGLPVCSEENKMSLCHKTFKKHFSSFDILYQHKKYCHRLCVLLSNNEYKIVNDLNAQ